MFRVYRAYFAAYVNVQLQYRVAVLIWMIGLVVQPLVALVVWRTVAGSGAVHGFTGGDFAAYFLVLMLVNHVTFTWVMYDYEYLVRTGGLAMRLLKPIHPIHGNVAENFSYKMVTLVVAVPTFFALAWLFHPAFHTTPLQLALWIPALVLAAAMRFLVEYTLALAAFYTTRTGAVNQLYAGLMMFLSGQVAPLALLPGPVRAAATILPFRGMIAFPTELAIGRLGGIQIAQGFALQLVWLFLGYLWFRLAWRRGVRQFTSVGA